VITRREYLKLSLAAGATLAGGTVFDTAPAYGASEEVSGRIAKEIGLTDRIFWRLWNRVRGRDVPDWGAEFGAYSWAQFFLKFALSHPAVTVVTPATSRARHMIDNLGAAHGALPDQAMRARMIAHVDALPSA
jgi:aryl-alcohol dehydrogenase-like predicted oxidoreductase